MKSKHAVVIITLLSMFTTSFVVGSLLAQFHLESGWVDVKLPLILFTVFTGMTFVGYKGYIEREY